MTAVRQACMLTLTFLTILLLAGFAGIVLIKNEIEETVDLELSSTHQALAEQILATSIRDVKLPNSALLFATLKSYNGDIIGPKFSDLLSPTDFSNHKLKFKRDKDTWRILSANIPTNKGVLLVAINMEQRYEVLEIVTKLFLIIGLLSTVITLFVGLYLGFRNQRRYSNISIALNAIAAGDLTTRINPSQNADDLDQVALHIDSATLRLETLLQQSKNLSANIAHDLKTPMARLRAKLEKAVVESEKKLADTDIIHQAVNDSLEQSDQIIATFEAILRIAHLSSGQYRERFKECSLSSLVTEAADIYRPVIEDSQHSFELKVDSDHHFFGDRELIIQLIANLLENALRHTPPGSTITLACQNKQLFIADNGPGINEDLRLKVLQPMYRLEQSRHTSGNGLGLSLVDTISQLHRAKLVLTNNDDSQTTNPGLKVCIVFP